MNPMLLEFMPGEPVPQAFPAQGPVACGLNRRAFVAAFRADDFTPERMETFITRPCTLCVVEVHRFAVALEFRFDTSDKKGEEPLRPVFTHSAVLQWRSGIDAPLLLKQGLLIHVVAYRGSPERIVAVRRGVLDKPTAWKWRCLEERHLRAAEHFELQTYSFEMRILMDSLPEPLPDNLVRARQVLPPPSMEEMRFCVHGPLPNFDQGEAA